MSEEFETMMKAPVKTGGRSGPVPHNVLQEFLDTCGYTRPIKSKIVDLVQKNNRKGIYEYTIDFVPGTPVKVEGGRFVK